jgi:hypothetical protein
VTIRLQKTDFNLKLEIYSSSIFSLENPTSIAPIISKIPKRFGKKSIAVFLKIQNPHCLEEIQNCKKPAQTIPKNL